MEHLLVLVQALQILAPETVYHVNSGAHNRAVLSLAEWHRQHLLVLSLVLLLINVAILCG